MNLQVVIDQTTDDGANVRHAGRDRDLLEALRRQDPLAAECLVSKYGDRAYRLAIGITGNSEDGEEAVQDAFWTVVRKIDTFRGESAFGSWLYRIVANAAHQIVRSRRSRRNDVSLDEVLPVFDKHGRHAEPVADWSLRGDDPALQLEMRTALTEAIHELPAAYRIVLLLRDVEGRSNAEVAEAVGVSIPVAKTRVHRARLHLRKRLGECMATMESLALGVAVNER